MTNLRQTGRLKPYSRGIEATLRLMDISIISGSLVALQHFLLHARFESYLLLGLLSSLCFLAVSSAANLYRSHRLEKRLLELLDILKCWGATIMAILLLGFAFKITDYYSRILIGTWFLMCPLMLMVTRIVIRGIAVRARSQGHNTRAAAIIGKGDTLSAIKNLFLAESTEQVRAVKTREFGQRRAKMSA